MAMKTEQQVRAMLQKFDDADDGDQEDIGGNLDCDQEAIRDTLLWVLGNGRSDADLEEYLEDM